MAPKKKEKAKKKKGKSSSGSAIAAGIIPNAGFVATPRTTPTPPPTENVPNLDLGLSQQTGVLTSSMLGRMFRTPSNTGGGMGQRGVPVGGDLTAEDTDTSLYDYELGKGTMQPYGSLGREAIPEHQVGSRVSYSERERAATPPGPFYEVLEGSGQPEMLLSETGEPLYSQPRKFHNRSNMADDSIPGSSSLRRFNDDDQATLRRSQRGRGSKRSRRSSTRSVEERIESQMVTTQQSGYRGSPLPRGAPSPIPKGSASGRESPYSHGASPRLRTLRAQNEELIQKQLYLEQQLKEQQEQQQQMLDKLVQKGLLASQDEDTVSLLHQTQKMAKQPKRGMTDRSIRKQDELFKSQQERIRLLEDEKNELTELNEQLQAEIYSLKKMTSFREDGEGGSHENMLKRQLQDYKDECSTMKATVHRLNVELSRYQAKFRPLKPHELKDSVGIPGKGPKPSWLIDTKYLAPLFLSYDDRLVEKEEAVREAKEELEVIKQNIDEVIRENQRLHLRIEQSDVTGPVSMTEWRQLQEQCRLVLEENQLLMEQIDMQQNKAKDMHRANVQQVTRLSKQFTSLESEKKTIEVAFESVQQKMVELSEKTGSHFAGSFDEQLKVVSDLKSNLESEKSRHTQEIENILTKIKLLSADKKGIEVQLENIKSENKQLSGEVKALHKAQRKSHRKVLLLQHALSESEVKGKSSEKYLKSVVRVAEQTVKERDLLFQTSEDKEREKELAISRMMEESMTQQRMEEKLKMYKLKATEKLERAANRMKEQDDDFNKQRQEYNREIKHMRNLLNEREALLEGVVGEKKRVEDDLETMWQVATHDNQQMKETMKQNIRKLREHEAFRGIGDVEYDQYLLTCTEDEQD